MSSDGLLATCAHARARGTPIGAVLPDGRRVAIADVVVIDSESDLAIVRVEGVDHVPLRLAGRHPSTGQPLVAVTKAGRFATECLGSATDSSVGDVITFVAAEHGPGSSGGALLDANARVVGVIMGGFGDGEREGVAVPAKRLTELLELAREAEDSTL